MTDVLSVLVNNFQQNSFLQTFVSVSGAGILTFCVRDIGLKFVNFVKSEFTTELTITSHHKVYHKLLKWIEETNKSTSFRKLKASNGVWGHDSTVLSVGVGKHLIKYRDKLLLVNLIKEAGNQTQYDKESLVLTVFGRDNGIFKTLIQDIEDSDDKPEILELYSYSSGWSYIRNLHKRALHTVFIEKELKNLLEMVLTKFLSNETFYLENGFPYQLGILLYGPPGTGKSSLIKAIASFIGYPIYYLPVTSLSHIQDAVRTVPSKCILVIEDIAANSFTFSNEKGNEFSIINLSEVLNSLDGLIAPHGRILLVTTNHLEKLDPALIRPGRIDYKLKIDYLSKEVLQTFLKTFYHKEVDLTDYVLKNCLTVAELQQFVLTEKSLEEVLCYCKQL